MLKRYQIVLEMRQQGATFQAIGKTLGVSTSRAAAIHQRALAMRVERDAGLRMRSIRILKSSTRTPEEWARMAAEDRKAAFFALISAPKCDRQHAQEILEWLDAGHRELPHDGKSIPDQIGA